MRNYGQSVKYFHDFVAISSWLDELQAAILRVKLQYLEAWNQRRRNAAKFYNEYPTSKTIEKPIKRASVKHVYHLYVIKHKERDLLQKHLVKKGIQTLIHYPIPVHIQKSLPARRWIPGFVKMKLEQWQTR